MSLIASTYAQDGARTRKAQNKAKGMQQNKTDYHIGHKHTGSKDLVNQLPEHHRCLALILTANIFAEG